MRSVRRTLARALSVLSLVTLSACSGARPIPADARTTVISLDKIDCADCGEQHYHEWSLLRASLQQLLDEGQMRPHEPAFDPDPAHYVTWEYCRGYADAVLSDS